MQSCLSRAFQEVSRSVRITKYFGLFGFLALVLTIPAAFSQDAAPPQEQGQPGAHHRQLPKPTNLQVLPKDIKPEELIHIMRGYAGALGVECNFCHVRGQNSRQLDFASDAKPDKGIARTMIRMTEAANQQFMSQVHDPDATPQDKQVTCGTCHRGHHMPEHFVPPPGHHGPGGAAPQAPAPGF